ncbi:lipoprotein [Lysinibacillus alkalisoli]|uniref:Lipoprotein n=1 Tax=Lysinibacillus alkalisoli TaxID=1911548 RepID=A0A917LIL3_9BACI|nr:MetQ/NlpA family ABC transporter substrate-binding protein [Lysinibacillus alkalisoli]GGG26869.1 lipoprotein [Lysinibacillus alkalisoli]
MKKIVGLLIATIVLLIAGCSNTDANEQTTIKVGIRSSEMKTWEFVKEQAEKEGLTLELVTFSSAYDPNDALREGEIDLNAFQHIAYLETYNNKTNSKLIPLGTTIIAPLGIYSNNIKALPQIEEGAQVAIPNDPSNWGRALVLLQEAGLLTVVDDFDGLGGEDKIKSNPKNLKIIPMDSFTTPRAMEDTDIAIINNGIATDAGLSLKDAIFHESETAKPYINIIATDDKNKDNTNFKKVVDVYQSDTVKQFIEKKYNGNYIPVSLSRDELAQWKQTFTN